MANYLPVLLVSVTNTSIVPDDSSVSTLPRGQVDYLSHDWQEEDVWRSWRKMTRQKNEITNGIRLENASWRTWWKQRNKLKTVTPETLNWLKDSDVTWLYGPLHTAVEWTPPVRLKHDGRALPRRGTDQPRHKPILKYRSISELLTSELPTSPVFSPTESETEARQETSEAQNVSVLVGQSPLSKPFNPKRPALVHTKSDTHIARWGPDRAFRKDSPPRIDPPGSSSGCIATNQSKSSVDGYFSQSQVRPSCSQDSNSSTGTSTTGLTNRRSCHPAHKKKHISFNTFVEQCIAIEKPNNEDDTPKLWGERKWDYDDGYEEDKEDNDDDDGEIWIRHTPHHLTGSAIAGSDSESGDDEGKEAEEEDDEVLEMRPRSYSHIRGTPRKQRAARSPSTSASISTPSSRSTSASSPSRSLSPSSPTRRRQMSTSSVHPIAYTPRGPSRRSSTTSAYRPRPHLYSASHHPFMRTRVRGGGVGGSQNIPNRNAPHTHVTIAPIAPTILKTTGSGYDGWAEGFGDEGGSDDGLWGSKWGAYTDGEGWKERDKVQTQDDEATPVELVYVPPPFGGHYSVGSDAGTEEEDFDIDAEERTEEDDTPRPSSSFATLRIIEDAPIAESPQLAGHDLPFVSTVTPPTPTVVVESQSLQPSEVQEHSIPVSENEVAVCSPLDGQNLQGSISRRPFSPEDRHSTSRSRSRTHSRSHSRSRTPSPAVSIPSSETPKNVAAPVPSRRSSSISPPGPPSSLLCPPVQRGRSASYQDLPTRAQRGRSSTRTPPSYSDRERQGESPIGSLSPDSSFVRVASIVGGVYANGRTDKERQKEKERREEQYRDRGRDGERGRDRTGRGLSQSLSPDMETGTSKRENLSTEERADHSSAPTKNPSSATEETGYANGTTQAPTKAYPQEAPRLLYTPSPERDYEKVAPGSTNEGTRWTSEPTSLILNTKAALAGPAVPKIDTASYTPSQPPNVLYNSSTVSPHRSSSYTQGPTTSHASSIGNSATPCARSPMKGKSPLLVPPPHPVEPSTSLNISPPVAIQSLPVKLPQQPQSPSSPTEKEPTIVEKAVGIMSSAGAFLGLWHP